MTWHTTVHRLAVTVSIHRSINIDIIFWRTQSFESVVWANIFRSVLGWDKYQIALTWCYRGKCWWCAVWLFCGQQQWMLDMLSTFPVLQTPRCHHRLHQQRPPPYQTPQIRWWTCPGKVWLMAQCPVIVSITYAHSLSFPRFIILSAGITPLIVTPGTNSCICVAPGQCTFGTTVPGGNTDGSGLIDIRIVNSVGLRRDDDENDNESRFQSNGRYD